MSQLSLMGLMFENITYLELEENWLLPLGESSMAMTLGNIQTHFKQLGKFIVADKWSREQTLAVKKMTVGAIKQNAAADSDRYDDLQEAVVPFNAKMAASVLIIEKVSGNAKEACEKLLTNVIAVDLGLNYKSSMAVVGPALIAAMNDVSAVVAPAGVEDANVDGFAVYFKNILGITLPEDADPNIPDSYIDDDLVA